MSGELEVVSQVTHSDENLVSTIARVEIDTLIATARSYPRIISVVQKRMHDLAILDEQTAEEAVFSLPRGGKTIEGPSIRFAEMAAQSWGNSRVASRTTFVDRVEKFVEAEGFFLDAETNVATLARVRRRLVDKYGKLYNDDMIIVTSNAAQSIARRNAILAGIPKAVWRKPYEAARKVIMGDIKTLANRRAEAIKAFQRFGITEAQVLLLMSVQGVEDIDLEKLVPLRGMYSALMNQDVTVEELLRGIEPEKQARVTPMTAAKDEPQFSADAPSADAPAKEPAKQADIPADNRATEAAENASAASTSAAKQPDKNPDTAAAKEPALPLDEPGAEIILGDLIAAIESVAPDAEAMAQVITDNRAAYDRLSGTDRAKVDAVLKKSKKAA